jgi:ubiquinone/menaquinone biosynthesis C-methylase UbiE
MSTNIQYWEKILENPSSSYQEFFDRQKSYLIENIISTDKVLDVGCGDGKNIETILLTTEKVTGVDNDPVAINDAKNKLQNHVSSIDLVCCDALQLPFESETFDVITCLELIGNLGDNKISALKENYRVLKQNGYLILSTYSEDAFDARMKIYEQIKIPIEKIEGTKVYFDKSVGAYESEQFSLNDLEMLGIQAGFKMVDHIKIGIFYICKFIKD